MRSFIFGICALVACSSGTDETQQEHSSGAEHTAEHHGHHGQGHHHDFSDVERFAAIFDAPNRDEWQKPTEIVTLMNLATDAIVADLGAGTGYFLPHLSQAVSSGHVHALDVESAMVAHMEQRIEGAGWTNVSAREISTDDPGLEDGSVDAILIVDTWHHIANRSAYAAKLARALKPTGAVWIVDFTLDAPQGPPAEMRIAPEQTIRELSQGGLSAELVQETLPYQYVVRATAER